jgi:hypothetical protein
MPLFNKIIMINNMRSNITYKNILDNKPIILKENKNKSGVYKITNITTNEYYVGSSKNIGKRFYRYFSIKYLKNKTERHNSRIYTAILDNGYNNFTIEILEYCDTNILLNREQYYMDILKPKYNIALKAGSLLGFKHSPETKLKFKNRENNTGHPVIIINKESNNTKEYPSVRAASKDINISHTTLLRYINEKKLLLNKQNSFLISKKKI